MALLCRDRFRRPIVSTHLFKISPYSAVKEMSGDKLYISSGRFPFLGYQWSIRYYPEEAYPAGTSSMYDSVGISADRRDVDNSLDDDLIDAEFAVIGRSQTRPVLKNHKCIHLTGVKPGSLYKCTKFLRVTYNTCVPGEFIIDGCLEIQCTLRRCHSINVKPRAAGANLPESDLVSHLSKILDSKEGADVTFHVGGKTFQAHRWLLAARSPVFKALLTGQMKEAAAGVVSLQDVEPNAFETLLRFAYTDTLPDSMTTTTAMLMQLLGMADKYGMTRMKMVLEDKLCQVAFNADTVAAMLELAVQYGCRDLKAVCTEFIVAAENVEAVLASEGFKQLEIWSPSVVLEMLCKMKRKL